MSDETPLILGDAVAAEFDRPSRRRRWFRSKKQRPPLTHCENCGTLLVGPYCARCGQPAIDYRRSLGSLLVDAADAFFNLDARFFQSFGLLLVKPWRLTNEFIEGKRARHVHPLRVYLIASVIFFLVINFLARGTHLQPGHVKVAPHSKPPPRLFSIEMNDDSPTPKPGASVPGASADFIGPLPPVPAPAKPAVSLGVSPEPPADVPGKFFSRSNSDKPSPTATPDHKVFFEELDKQKNVPPLLKWVEERAKEKLGPTGDRGDLFLKALIQNIAPMVLCCIPLFALVLKILYIFKRRFYVDHLIFALHTHAFIFLSTVVIIGLGFLINLKSTPLTGVTCTFLGFAVIAQLLIAIRRVYRQNWFATIFKFSLGSVIYVVMLSVAFGVTAFVTLLLP